MERDCAYVYRDDLAFHVERSSYAVEPDLFQDRCSITLTPLLTLVYFKYIIDSN